LATFADHSAQVGGCRLLCGQDRQACPVHLEAQGVDLDILGHDLPCELQVARFERSDRVRYRLADHLAHTDKAVLQEL
jgi:hypothetical protein